jgi:Antitoxin Xre-like helix-turn-helix domain/Antitoxin Xre/MbcA/ParS C-terminal toxin-binding domain
MSAELAAPVIAGYTFDRAPNLTDKRERDRLSQSALRAFLNIVEKWGLNEIQARGLLGGIASSTFHTWKTEPRGKKLDQDTLMRISLIIGVYKALNIYFSKPWADRWVGLANRGPMFAGQAPIDYMLQHGQPGMLQVRRMLDSWRGGR